jgi:hypothetical protein
VRGVSISYLSWPIASSYRSGSNFDARFSALRLPNYRLSFD